MREAKVKKKHRVVQVQEKEESVKIPAWKKELMKMKKANDVYDYDDDQDDTPLEAVSKKMERISKEEEEEEEEDEDARCVVLDMGMFNVKVQCFGEPRKQSEFSIFTHPC